MEYSTTRFPIMNNYHVKQPQWSKDAVIYQVNTRQFSEYGQFDGVTAKLDHIKALGATIIWLMPIHPIGHVNRKGSLGSPYSVKDFLKINPELGDEKQLTRLVEQAHARELKIIIDWVPNHSAWDNPLTQTHPHWYARDHEGNFRPSPWWDWTDIIEFDYSQPDLRSYMIDAMAYWIKTFNIDGFRCDVAGYVPNDFWQQARQYLESIKPVFMLAEWEVRDLHERAFNMTYAWSWNEACHDIAMGKAPVDRLRKYYSWNERAWPMSAYRMTFVSNHDKNSWDGTQHEQFGTLLEAFIVLSVIGEGMPLIYNGQECGESKRLAFFERDPIEWNRHEIGNFYTRLIALKKRFTALHNGEYGARMIQVDNNAPQHLLSFVRQKEGIQVMVCLNLSQQTVATKLYGSLVDSGTYHTHESNAVEDNGSTQFVLPAGGYIVRSKKGLINKR